MTRKGNNGQLWRVKGGDSSWGKGKEVLEKGRLVGEKAKRRRDQRGG